MIYWIVLLFTEFLTFKSRLYTTLNNITIAIISTIATTKEIVYDHKKNKVHTITKGTEDVPMQTLDIVSAFYHARNNTFDDNLDVGDTIMYTTYFAGEVFPLRIKYRGRECVKTKFGNIMCHKFSPITEVGRAFKTEDDMQVWISCDGNRLPIRIQFDMWAGSFVCELTNYKGLMYPIKTI